MPQPQQPNPWRYAHLGLELAGAIIVLGLVGLWVDYRWGTGPWGVLGGVLVGAVGGLYLFIKDALAANRQSLADSRAGRRTSAARHEDQDHDHDEAPRERREPDAGDAGTDPGPDESARPDGPERTDAPEPRGPRKPDDPDDP